MPEQNSFTGANLTLRNTSLHTLLAEIIKFRKQLIVRPEFQQQSGWDNAINRYLMTNLEALNDTIENITYNEDVDRTKDEREGAAADTSGSLAKNYADGVYSIHSDNVPMPVLPERPVLWALDGSDPDIPQPTEEIFHNDFARIFIKGLDNFFVTVTRLDSRHQMQGITKNEGEMLQALLDELYTITQRKGGEDNRVDIPQGTLPSEEPNTFNAKAI